MRFAHAAAVVLLLGACDHSVPFAGPGHGSDGPFTPGAPARLTYSLLGDFEPTFTADGAWITYVFERPGNQDRCIGVLPATGGSRRAEACPWPLPGNTTKFGLANAALRDDGMMLFTRHDGRLGSLSSLVQGVWLAHPDSVARGRQVLALGTTPPGASARWDDLVDPIWVSADEVMALAARRQVISLSCDPIAPLPNGCPVDYDRQPQSDTVVIGSEIVRLRVNSPASIVGTIPTPGAVAWSRDRVTGDIYYVQRTAAPHDVEFFFESVVDTLFRVPAGGGAPVPVYGIEPNPLRRPLMQIHGVAARAGRVLVSRSYREHPQVIGGHVARGAYLKSDIVEILADGTPWPVADQPTWRWGRLAISPDGRRLVAESVERTSSDLYLFELQP